MAGCGDGEWNGCDGHPPLPPSAAPPIKYNVKEVPKYHMREVVREVPQYVEEIVPELREVPEISYKYVYRDVAVPQERVKYIETPEYVPVYYDEPVEAPEHIVRREKVYEKFVYKPQVNFVPRRQYVEKTVGTRRVFEDLPADTVRYTQVEEPVIRRCEAAVPCDAPELVRVPVHMDVPRETVVDVPVTRVVPVEKLRVLPAPPPGPVLIELESGDRVPAEMWLESHPEARGAVEDMVNRFYAMHPGGGARTVGAPAGRTPGGALGPPLGVSSVAGPAAIPGTIFPAAPSLPASRLGGMNSCGSAAYGGREGGAPLGQRFPAARPPELRRPRRRQPSASADGAAARPRSTAGAFQRAVRSLFSRGTG